MNVLQIACISFLVAVVDSIFLDLRASARCPANMQAKNRPIYGIADKAPFWKNTEKISA